MKTSLEIPDELVRELKIHAAREGRKLKDVVADSLRQTLQRAAAPTRSGIRSLKPLSVGRVLAVRPDGDLMEDMLDARSHRY